MSKSTIKKHEIQEPRKMAGEKANPNSCSRTNFYDLRTVSEFQENLLQKSFGTSKTSSQLGYSNNETPTNNPTNLLQKKEIDFHPGSSKSSYYETSTANAVLLSDSLEDSLYFEELEGIILPTI